MSQRAEAGTVIEGKYRLERELGAGGMGSVWLATQLMVDRNVAVKLLHPAFIESDDLQARFEVEAKAIGRLNHPNCITLFDFGHSDELKAFYTVIEFVDGESLDKRLGNLMPLEQVCNIIRHISLALDHAHHQGILHRDLKPENVMMAQMTDGSEMVKVLDFGIARIVKGDAAQEAERITKAGEVFGTPAYMSPEQARSTRQLKPSSDLYSLGVMFYELIAGNLPFFAHSAFDLLMMHVTKPVPPIERDDVPDELKNLIYRLLEKEPEKRPQSGKELADLIAEIDLEAVPETASATSAEISGPVPTLLHAPSGDDAADGDDEDIGLDDTLAAPVTEFLPADTSSSMRTSPELATLETDAPANRSRMWSLSGILFAVLVLVALLLINFFGDDDSAQADPTTELDPPVQRIDDPGNDPMDEQDEREAVADQRIGAETKEESEKKEAPILKETEPTAPKTEVAETTKKVEKETAPKTKTRPKPRPRPRPKDRPKPRPRPKPDPKPDDKDVVFESLSPSEEDSVEMPSVDL